MGLSVLADHADALARPGCSGSSAFARFVVPSKRLGRNPDAIPSGDDGGGEGAPYEEYEMKNTNPASGSIPKISLMANGTIVPINITTAASHQWDRSSIASSVFLTAP